MHSSLAPIRWMQGHSPHLTSIEVLKSRSRATSGTSPFSDSSFAQEVARVVTAAFKTSR
jgi:hypothetical protein